MANLRRVRVVWNGLPGGTGLSTFYSNENDITGALATLYDAVGQQVPSVVSWTIPSSGDIINDATGQITGTWTGGTGTTVAADNAGAFAGASGCVVDLLTDGIVAGRRVKGRQFIVPLSNDQYDRAGSLSAASITAMIAAWDPFIAEVGSELRIWSRPFKPPLGSTKPARGGSSYPVTSFTVPDLAAVLRSRRN